MTEKELEILIKKREMQQIEFKESFGVETIETACAFANAAGGYIILGVNDKGDISKLPLRDEALRDYENRIATSTEPSVAVDAEKVPFRGEYVIALKVIENPLKPVSFKSRSYIRKGSVNHKMTPTEISECHLKSTGSSMDAVIVPRGTKDDLDMNKVAEYMKKANSEKRRNFDLNDDPWLILKKLEWVRSETEITRASYLLFARNPQIKFPQAIIHIGAFKDDGFILDGKDISGNIQDQAEESLSFIKRNIRRCIVITGKAEHDRYWEYPMEALRETITNAICHRDYGSPHTIQIQIIENRIIVCSPGELPFDMSIDKLLNKFHPSRPRNKIIAQAFYDMHLTEFYGSGIRRIRKECEINGNAFPSLSNEMGAFTATYFSRQIDDSINPADDTINPGDDTINPADDTINPADDTINPADDTINPADDPIKSKDDPIKSKDDPIKSKDDPIKSKDDPIKSEDDPIKSEDDPIKSEDDPIKSKDDPIKLELSEQIYELITRNPGINRETIAKTVGRSVETVKRVLKKLRNSKHRIEFRGSKKTGGYYLIKKQDSKNE